MTSSKRNALLGSVVLLIALAYFLFSSAPEEMTSDIELTTAASIENDAGTRVLRLGHDASAASALHAAAQELARRVHTSTAGRIQIEVHPAQELGTDSEMIGMLQRGELDIALPPTAKLSQLTPEVQLFDAPFIFNSRQQAYSVLDGTLGQAIFARLQPHGLHCPVAWESGFKQLTANRPLTQMKDFSGLNIRTMKSQLILKQYRALGANPVPIEFYKTRSALKEGIVSAQENPLSSIVGMGFHDVQDYLILSNHSYLAQLVCFSQQTLDSLTPQQRSLMVDTATQLAGFQRQLNQEHDRRYLETIRQSGTQIIELSDQEKDQLASQTNIVIHDLMALLDNESQQLARQLLQNRTEKNPVVIGLNADLSLGSAPAGIAIRRGMQIAVDEINARGGVLGRPLVIDARDHQGIAQRGVSNVRKLANNPDLVAIMAGLHSPVALAEVPVITQLNIPYLVPWAAATPIVDNGFEPNWVFRLSIRDADVGGFLIDEALKHSSRVGLLLEQTGWGRSNQKAMSLALAQHGLEPSHVAWFNWGQSDFSEQLRAFERADTDTIILVANAPEGVLFVKNLARFGKAFRVISHWGITGGYFAEQVGDADDDLALSFVQTFSFLNNRSTPHDAVVAAYLEKYGIQEERQIFAPTGTAHAYDLVHLLALAIEQAGRVDRVAIRHALEHLPAYDGLVRHYARPFAPDQHEALSRADLRMASFSLDGAIVPHESE